MDKRYHIVRHLYDEGDPPELPSLLEDEALRKEYQALSEVKLLLDQRGSARPDPEVLDRIMAAAAASPAPSSDRQATPLRLVRFRTVGAMAAMVALLLAVGLVWRQGGFNPVVPSSAPVVQPHADGEAAAPDDAVAEADTPGISSEPSAREATPPAPTARPPASAPPKTQRRAEEEAGAPGAALAAAPRAVADQTAKADSVPAWDEADELLRLHRRLEMLEARSRALAWDDSSVISLDALPTDNPGALRGLDAVSTQKHNQ